LKATRIIMEVIDLNTGQILKRKGIVVRQDDLYETRLRMALDALYSTELCVSEVIEKETAQTETAEGDKYNASEILPVHKQ